MKTAALITARLKSTRLSRKALRPLVDRPMICHLIDRVKRIEDIDTIVLCTSFLKEDEPLVEIALQEGIRFYQGDPNDVLLRLGKAASEIEASTVFNCTADNPLVDPDLASLLIQHHLGEKNDYSFLEGAPIGTYGWALETTAIEKACKMKTTAETECWGGYFTETAAFKFGKFQVTDPKISSLQARLTVDTPEDFSLMERIFSRLYKKGSVFSLREVEELLRREKALLNLNNHITQKPAPPVQFTYVLHP